MVVWLHEKRQRRDMSDERNWPHRWRILFPHLWFLKT